MEVTSSDDVGVEVLLGQVSPRPLDVQLFSFLLLCGKNEVEVPPQSSLASREVRSQSATIQTLHTPHGHEYE